MAKLIDLHDFGYAWLLFAQVGEYSAGRHVTFSIDLDGVDDVCPQSVRDV